MLVISKDYSTAFSSTVCVHLDTTDPLPIHRSLVRLLGTPSRIAASFSTLQTVAVLDTVEGVYVWRGIKSDSFQYNLISRACQEYCLHKPLPVGRRVIKVREGHEPLVFRARFQAWDDGGPGDVKKFQDIYEQRVVQMSVSLIGVGWWLAGVFWGRGGA